MRAEDLARISTLTTSTQAGKTTPSWNLVTLQDLAVPAESQRFVGERAGSHNVESMPPTP